MKLKSLLAVAAIGVLTTSTSVLAAKASFTSTTKGTDKIPVKSVSYDYDDADDDIDLDFSSNIKLKSNAKATVKDSSGKSYKAYIEDHDRDELDIDVTNLKAGRKYTVTITGIKKSNASKYGTLTVNFSIPKASSANLVKEVDYDAEDREVSFDFRRRVSYKKPQVVITNTSNTKTYTTRITEKDNDELSVYVKGLKRGETYKYKITGVIDKTDNSSKTLTGTFKAIDR